MTVQISACGWGSREVLHSGMPKKAMRISELKEMNFFRGILDMRILKREPKNDIGIVAESYPRA